MKFGQHGPGFGALLINEAAAGFPVQAKCVGRSAVPVQSRHLMRDECLIQRVLSQQMAKLPDQLGIRQLQLAFDAIQDGGPALLFEAVAHPRHPVAGDPGQRLAMPELVRFAQQGGRMSVLAAGGERARLPAQAAEPVHVDRLGIYVKHVASRAPGQPYAVAQRLPERRPKPGDVDRETLAGLRRRPGVPHPVNEGLGRHDSARCQQEDGQDPPRPGRPRPIAARPTKAQLARAPGIP